MANIESPLGFSYEWVAINRATRGEIVTIAEEHESPMEPHDALVTPVFQNHFDQLIAVFDRVHSELLDDPTYPLGTNLSIDDPTFVCSPITMGLGEITVSTEDGNVDTAPTLVLGSIPKVVRNIDKQKALDLLVQTGGASRLDLQRIRSNETPIAPVLMIGDPPRIVQRKTYTHARDKLIRGVQAELHAEGLPNIPSVPVFRRLLVD